jgi:hypothetical protein
LSESTANTSPKVLTTLSIATELKAFPRQWRDRRLH